MREVEVHGDACAFAVSLAELIEPVFEGEDFRRTGNSEVERVEEEHDLAPAVLRE